jgi:ATP-dependent DNA ligase
LNREAIETGKTELVKLLRKADYGIFFNEHVEDEAAVVFQHACKLGLEGIVSKRRGSPYVSGRSPHWLKLKNPNSAAVKREAERGVEPSHCYSRRNLLVLQAAGKKTNCVVALGRTRLEGAIRFTYLRDTRQLRKSLSF